MNEEKLRRIFPHISNSTIAANQSLMLPREVLDAAAKGASATAPPQSEKKGRRVTRAEEEYRRILEASNPGATIRYEAYTLKLAADCRYTPDFAIEKPDGTLEFHEVKGAFIFSKALTKPRTAAELFPQRFVLAQKLKTGWEITPLKGKADR